MLKQATKKLNNEAVDKTKEAVQLSDFIKNYLVRHKYKEYRDEEGRLIVEVDGLKMVQVRQNNADDKEFYIQLFKKYLSYILSTGSIDKQDEQDVNLIDYDAVFEEETTHKDYNEYPMFFVYDTTDECLGMAGFRAYEEYEYEGKVYQAQEMSWRMPVLRQKAGLEKKRGVIMLLTSFFAYNRNQCVSGHMFECYKDVAFHYQDYIKNLKFLGKEKIRTFFPNTEQYHFMTI